jgi:hypothetical protein
MQNFSWSLWMRYFNTLSVIASAAFLLPLASAQAIAPLDRASFSVGFAIPDNSTTLDFNSNVSGVPVDFSRDLGLETENVIAVLAATWRPWDNHQFGFGYFKNKGEKTKTLANPIEWNGVVYDGTVKASLDVSTYDFSYIWWGLNKENYALGPSLRLSYITFDSNIDLTADANGVPIIGGQFRRSANTDVPAPTLGVAWRWTPAEQWRINMEAGYMQATIGDYDGSALVASGGVTWFPWENWGFSLNALYMDFDVSKDDSDFDGDLEVKQSNFNFGVTYRF